MSSELHKESGPGRRSLLKWLAAFGAGALFYPVWSFLGFTGRQRGAARVPEMVIKRDEPVAVGGSFLVKFNGRLVLIIRLGDHEWVALDAICTHMGCPLHHDPEVGEIVCVCHEGRYDLSGKVIEGPPPRPLRKYFLEERDGELVLHS